MWAHRVDPAYATYINTRWDENKATPRELKRQPQNFIITMYVSSTVVFIIFKFVKTMQSWSAQFVRMSRSGNFEGTTSGRHARGGTVSPFPSSYYAVQPIKRDAEQALFSAARWHLVVGSAFFHEIKGRPCSTAPAAFPRQSSSMFVRVMFQLAQRECREKEKNNNNNGDKLKTLSQGHGSPGSATLWATFRRQPLSRSS